MSISNKLNQGMEHVEKMIITPLGLTLILYKIKISQGHKLKNGSLFQSSKCETQTEF